MLTMFMQEAERELADNWPAFTYILLMIAFSLIFFRERREERKDIEIRFDRLELLMRQRGRES